MRLAATMKISSDDSDYQESNNDANDEGITGDYTAIHEGGNGSPNPDCDEDGVVVSIPLQEAKNA